MKPWTDEEVRWYLSLILWLIVSWMQTAFIVSAIKDMS